MRNESVRSIVYTLLRLREEPEVTRRLLVVRGITAFLVLLLVGLGIYLLLATCYIEFTLK